MMAKRITYDYIRRELMPRARGTKILPANDERTCILELNPRADEPALCPKCEGTLRWKGVNEIKIDNPEEFAQTHGFMGAKGMGITMNTYECEDCGHTIYNITYIFSGNESGTEYIKWPQ